LNTFRSKQGAFNGRALLAVIDNNSIIASLRKHQRPLLIVNIFI